LIYFRELKKNYCKCDCNYYLASLTDDILLVICSFTDGIIYSSIVGDMLNFTKRIINRMKLVIFFGAHVSFVKLLVNYDDCFSYGYFSSMILSVK
jgi:hypothetical protein